MHKTCWILFFVLFIVWGCKKSALNNSVSPDSSDEKPVAYEYPAYSYNLAKNPITDDGFLLGKTLFYDGNLSRDGTISCAECHNQPYAFTHHGHALSHGIDGKIGTRNAPPIFNMGYQNTFMWDGGVTDLDLFPIAPITNHVEMDQNMTVLIANLNHSSTYPALFKKAFGSSVITTQNFLKALSQFVLSLDSKNAKYDQYVAGNATFSADEKAGLKLFMDKGCGSCHKPPLFTDFSFRSNGLDTTFFRDFVDYGRFKITENPSDKYKFKVPTLRNISNTFPYMHDGRFSTIEDALAHYASKVQKNVNLDAQFTQNGNLGIPLTADEQSKIITFLKTLTDDEFLKNKKFAAP